MLVRAYDEENGRFYVSAVYAKLNSGEDEQVVLFDPKENCFVLVKCIDENRIYKSFPAYEYVNEETNDWTRCDENLLTELQKLWQKFGVGKKLNSCEGYRDVLEDSEFITKIFRNKKVASNDTGQKTKDGFSRWNHIRTQEDADKFMELFYGFHDATLEKLVYDSGKYGGNRVKAVFENYCWFGRVELYFEGLTDLHLSPYEEVYINEISDGTLLVTNGYVFWADKALETEDLNYEGDYIRARSLKWRKIGE